MKRLATVSILLVAVAVLGAATLCHSTRFYLAKQELKKMTLTPVQEQEIDVYARDFQKKWNETHAKRGCSHHEAHVDEFIAAASGVLSDDQFKTFRSRGRNDVEKLGWRVRNTRIYAENLLKIAQSL
jgi:hypothetical protein